MRYIGNIELRSKDEKDEKEEKEGKYKIKL